MKARRFSIRRAHATPSGDFVSNPPREISQGSSDRRSQLGLLLFLALHYGLRVLRFTGYDSAYGPIIEPLLLQDSAALRGGYLEAYLRHRHGPATHA